MWGFRYNKFFDLLDLHTRYIDKSQENSMAAIVYLLSYMTLAFDLPTLQAC